MSLPLGLVWGDGLALPLRALSNWCGVTRWRACLPVQSRFPERPLRRFASLRGRYGGDPLGELGGFGMAGLHQCLCSSFYISGILRYPMRRATKAIPVVLLQFSESLVQSTSPSSTARSSGGKASTKRQASPWVDHRLILPIWRPCLWPLPVSVYCSAHWC